MPDVRGLAGHADYGCRHSGACCTSGWAIPVEHDLVPRLEAALAHGAVQPAGRGDPLVAHTGLVPGFGAILGRNGSRCVFHDAGGAGCRLHAALGAAGKPGACRQFPWITVHDPRGTFASLSHYCPTAAALLFAATPLRIQPLPARADLEGLDVRASLPPALTETMLLDWEGLSAWEAEVVAVCERCVTPEEVLQHLQALHRHAARWRPGATSLTRWLATLTPTPAPHATGTAPIDWSLDALVRTAIPAHLDPPAPFADAALVWEAGLRTTWIGAAPAIRRYLAARSIACWPLHAGRGLSTQRRYLEALLVMLRSEVARRLTDPTAPVPRPALVAAIRETNRLALHLADPTRLAARLDARR